MNSLKLKLFKYLLLGIWAFSSIALHANVSEKSSSENRTVKVLTIGNSFARNACQYLQEITESVPGCVWFGKFFNISPKKVKFIPDGMDKKTAKFLRKIAAKETKKQKFTTF